MRVEKQRILVVHNQYQHRGGEDTVVEAEVALLRSHGHEVDTWFRSNDDVARMSSLELARTTLWCDRTQHELADRVRRFQPDLIHAHNTFPLVSPSLYWAAARAGVPVVQTLHNFRLLCLNALFLREGRVCEDCMGHLPWRGVMRSCYRGSHAASAGLAGMLTLHRGLGTYRRKVTCFIALNEFCRGKFIEGGLPAERIVIKPNFVDFPESPAGPRAGLLFVGRLSKEKGVETLALAATRMSDPSLRIAGDGPEARVLRGLAGVTMLGNLPVDGVRHEMSHAMALVLPSIWYENFPRTLVEAFASSLPVITSRLGALAELVEDGVTGLLFTPGDPDDLAVKLRWALAHPEEMRRMGVAARERYELSYTPAQNYRELMSIYERAISDMREGQAA